MEIKNIVEICVAIDIAILGIAYPIIIDKISNIGDKYSSEYIPVLFNSEFPQRNIVIKVKLKQYNVSWFKLNLIATLVSFIFLIWHFPPWFNWNNEFINNSADILCFLLTLLLVWSFIIWISKVSIYNGNSKTLLTYLINKYHTSPLETETRNYNLKAINELALYAVEKQDEHLQETLLKFYETLFTEIRNNHDKSEPLIYPSDLYSIVYKLTQIASNNEK
jgi:hypothetical protein